MGDEEKALADFDEAIRLDPHYAVSLFNRGNMWFNKSDYDRAIADYEQAVRVDPSYSPAWNALGKS
jgi:tetratricopeptide (TPR) repeat protein